MEQGEPPSEHLARGEDASRGIPRRPLVAPETRTPAISPPGHEPRSRCDFPDTRRSRGAVYRRSACLVYGQVVDLVPDHKTPGGSSRRLNLADHRGLIGPDHRQDAGPDGRREHGPSVDEGRQVGVACSDFRFNCCPNCCPVTFRIAEVIASSGVGAIPGLTHNPLVAGSIPAGPTCLTLGGTGQAGQ